MRNCFGLLLVVGMVAGWATAGAAQELELRLVPPEPQSLILYGDAAQVYHCPWAESGVLIDGNIDDPAWEAAPWSVEFVDILGSLAPSPDLVTAVKLMWDSEYLYVAAVLEDPQLQASFIDDDGNIAFQDNTFQVFIDPDGDGQFYFELGANALNSVYDVLMTRPPRDGGRALFGWDIDGLRHGVRLGGSLNDDRDTDDGWLIELAIPWFALAEAVAVAVPPAPGEYWRMNFCRVHWDYEWAGDGYTLELDPLTGEPYPESQWAWSPIGLGVMHTPERWGYVVFTDGEEGLLVNPPVLPVELARQSLYTLYYSQHAYRDATGTFAWDTSLLDGYWRVPALARGGLIPVDDWADATIFLFPGGFTAFQPLPDGSAVWIDHTGVTWQAEPVASATLDESGS